MKKLLAFARTLAFKICQIGGVCVLMASAAAAYASPYLALGSVPQFFKVQPPPANVQKPKLQRDKVPDHLRIKYDRNFRHGLV
jgi:hypothetical protein